MEESTTEKVDGARGRFPDGFYEGLAKRLPARAMELYFGSVCVSGNGRLNVAVPNDFSKGRIKSRFGEDI